MSREIRQPRHQQSPRSQEKPADIGWQRIDNLPDPRILHIYVLPQPLKYPIHGLVHVRDDSSLGRAFAADVVGGVEQFSARGRR